MRRSSCVALVVVMLGAATDLVGQVPTPTRFRALVREWQVPWPDSRPRDPMADDQGRVWFVGQEGNFVARLDPNTGKFTKYGIDEGTHPHNVIVDWVGRAWYAGNRNAMIGRIDPSSGQVTRIRLTDPRLADPHTMAFDRRGNLWFTAQQGNAVARLETANGRVRTVPVPTARARPYGLVVDTLTDRPWFVEFGTNRIGTIDPNTFVLREYTLPDSGSRPRRIALANGRIWAGDYVRGALLELDPASGRVNSWPLPGGLQSLPYAMASDDRGRVWVAETGIQPNRIVAVESGTGRVIGEAVVAESGGGTIRHMTFDPRTRFIWFGTDKNTIGRVEVP